MRCLPGVKSKFVKRTFVSTDSEEYRQIALKWGAEAQRLISPVM